MNKTYIYISFTCYTRPNNNEVLLRGDLKISLKNELFLNFKREPNEFMLNYVKKNN